MHIKLIPTQMDDDEYLQQILDKVLFEENLNVAYRTGDLLGFDRFKLLSHLAEYMAKQLKLSESLSIIQELDEKYGGEKVADLIKQIIKIFVGFGVEVYLEEKITLGFSSTLLELTRLAVKNSKVDDLEGF
jgi:hypothetical protein